MNSFIERAGWSTPQPLAVDGSARRYFRVRKQNQAAILMDASAEQQTIAPFVAVADWLRSIGLSTPEIFEVDEAQGFILLEDFGDISFKKAIERGTNEFELYAMASDILAFLTHKNCPLKLPNYYESSVHIGRRRIIDWFVPAIRKEKNPDGLAEEFFKIWEDIEYTLPHTQQGFVHIDYHVENLMFLPERQDFKRCGLLDFQGAMVGPVLYDFANLLEDARRYVPSEIRETLWATLDEYESAWTRILASQFHCRVIGQCFRWAIRDGKPQYMEHIPRLQNYIHVALKDPLLKPLKIFFDDLKIDFSLRYDLNIPEISRYIRDDAF